MGIRERLPKALRSPESKSKKGKAVWTAASLLIWGVCTLVPFLRRRGWLNRRLTASQVLADGRRRAAEAGSKLLFLGERSQSK